MSVQTFCQEQERQREQFAILPFSGCRPQCRPIHHQVLTEQCLYYTPELACSHLKTVFLR